MKRRVEALLAAFRRGTALGSVQAILRTNILMQGISFVAVPVISRIYGPENYGVFAVFVTILGILTQLTVMRMDAAIDVPKSDEEALSIAHLCLFLGACMALFSGVLVLVAGEWISARLNMPNLALLLPYLPATLMLTIYGGVVGAWMARQRNFHAPSNIRLAAALVDVGTKIGLGLVGWTKSGQVLGSLLSTATMALLSGLAVRTLHPPLLRSFNIGRAARAGAAYRRFATTAFPATLMEMLGFTVPALVIGAHFGAAAAGFFYVADRLAFAPAAAVASAIRPVFKREAAIAMHATSDLRPILKETLRATGIIALLAFVVMSLAVPHLFDLLFDEAWAPALPLFQILLVARCVEIFTNPVTPVLLVRQSHLANLLTQTGFAAGSIAALLIGSALGSPQIAVLLFAGAMIGKYAAELFLCYHYSKPSTSPKAELFRTDA